MVIEFLSSRQCVENKQKQFVLDLFLLSVFLEPRKGDRHTHNHNTMKWLPLWNKINEITVLKKERSYVDALRRYAFRMNRNTEEY